MLYNKKPKLILVGAGPGDPDLITVKGIKALQNADVVLYDALVDESLLDYAKDAQLQYVGKRKGQHSYRQEDINRLIVENAFNYGTVVRLKGGDPFIFGRGAEEIAYADAFGISTEVIPGLSSSFAVPASQGISLTQRNVSQSCWVITGTTKTNELSADIHIASQSSATIVILMGMSKIEEIQSVFQKENKGDTPVAIIQNGTTPQEKIGLGTIDSVVNVVKKNNLSSPAIIVIGEVVKHHLQFNELHEKLETIYA